MVRAAATAPERAGREQLRVHQVGLVDPAPPPKDRDVYRARKQLVGFKKA